MTSEDEELWALHDAIKTSLVRRDDPDDPGDDASGCEARCACSGEPVNLDGDLVCERCLRVTDRILDVRPEWKSFATGPDGASNRTNAPSTERCGPPTNPLFPGLATSSVIGFGGCDPAFSKLRKYQMWSSCTYKDRCMFKLSESLNSHATKGSFPPAILDDAKTMYHELSKTIVSRGERRTGVIASCVFMACKKSCAPRSVSEIAAIFDTSARSVTQGCKKLQEILDVHVKSCKPVDFIRRYCTRLKRQDLAERVCAALETAPEVTDHSPTVVAAAAILIVGQAADPPVSRKEVAEACGLSQSTVAKCARKLANNHPLRDDRSREHASDRKIA